MIKKIITMVSLLSQIVYSMTEQELFQAVASVNSSVLPQTSVEYAIAFDIAKEQVETNIGILERTFSVQALSWLDKNSLACMNDGAKIRCFDVGTGREIEHTCKDMICAASQGMSPDGRYRATIYTDYGSIKASVKKTTSGLIYNLNYHNDRHGMLTHVGWSPDSKHIVGHLQGTEDKILLWTIPENYSTESISLRYTLHVPVVQLKLPIAWSPDSNYFARGIYKRVEIINVTTQEVMRSLNHGCAITTVAWSPDGDSIATATDDSKYRYTIYTWNSANGTRLQRINVTHKIDTIIWSPNSEYIAARSSSEDNIHIYSAVTGELISHYTDDNKMLIWSPNSEYIATYTHDNYQTPLTICEVKTGKEVDTSAANDTYLNILGFSWHPDSESFALVTPSDDQISLYKIKTYRSKKALTLKKHIRKNLPAVSKPIASTEQQFLALSQIQWSPDCTFAALVSQPSSLTLLNRVSTEVVQLDGCPENISCVAWNNNSTYIAAGSDEGIVVIWNAHTKKEIARIGLDRAIHSMSWGAQHAGYLAVCSADMVSLYHIESNSPFRLMKTLQYSFTEPFRALSFNNKGDKCLGVLSDRVVIIDCSTSTNYTLLTVQEKKDIHTAIWNHDGSCCVVAIGTELHIFDSITKELKHIISLNKTVSTIACSPDGAYIATGSSDGSIDIWRYGSLGLLHALTDGTSYKPTLGKQPIIALEWSRNSKHLLSNATDDRGINCAAIWDPFDRSSHEIVCSDYGVICSWSNIHDYIRCDLLSSDRSKLISPSLAINPVAIHQWITHTISPQEAYVLFMVLRYTQHGSNRAAVEALIYRTSNEKIHLSDVLQAMTKDIHRKFINSLIDAQ